MTTVTFSTNKQQSSTDHQLPAVNFACFKKYVHRMNSESCFFFTYHRKKHHTTSRQINISCDVFFSSIQLHLSGLLLGTPRSSNQTFAGIFHVDGPTTGTLDDRRVQGKAFFKWPIHQSINVGPSNWIISPGFGVKINKYLSCHHLLFACFHTTKQTCATNLTCQALRNSDAGLY